MKITKTVIGAAVAVLVLFVIVGFIGFRLAGDPGEGRASGGGNVIPKFVPTEGEQAAAKMPRKVLEFVWENETTAEERKDICLAGSSMMRR